MLGEFRAKLKFLVASISPLSENCNLAYSCLQTFWPTTPLCLTSKDSEDINRLKAINISTIPLSFEVPSPENPSEHLLIY